MSINSKQAKKVSEETKKKEYLSILYSIKAVKDDIEQEFYRETNAYLFEIYFSNSFPMN